MVRMERVRPVRSVCYKINYPWEDITDPLYLPLKRGGPVCPPLECPMISNGLDGKMKSVCYKINYLCGDITDPF